MHARRVNAVKLNSVVYNETIYPKETNTYLSKVRDRSPCEFNWILKPFCDMIWQADVINRAKEQKYYKAKMQLYKSEIERLKGTKFWEM